MTIHEKINAREQPWNHLTPPQYTQVLSRNILALVPYYKERLLRQLESVKEAESFKKVFGKYRYQLENNL